MVEKKWQRDHSTGMKRSLLVCLAAIFLVSALVAQEKPDALKLYRNGRDLETAGRVEDAKAAYAQAIDVCKLDLAENPKNMDAYTISGWALIRVGKYQESINVCLEALKITSDARIVETLGEGYFFLGNSKESLKAMERYIDMAPRGERISTAYFFVGEIYRMGKKYNRADIAYSAAVQHEPSIALWWFRLGAVRETVGDKKGSLEAYQRALKLRPDYKEATEGLGRVRT
jgi:tetratricopeptide (TPR) repeat protein